MILALKSGFCLEYNWYTQQLVSTVGYNYVKWLLISVFFKNYKVHVNIIIFEKDLSVRKSKNPRCE